MAAVVPFHSFIFKVASRCNLNCSYCFVYNREDQAWRQQPPLMTPEVARQAATRIREHCESHQKLDVAILFHGGEPLLGGLTHLREVTDAIKSAFVGSEIRLALGMQSNGLLLTDEIAAFLFEEGFSIGISTDGPPEVHDRWRVDHKGRGTSARLRAVLDRLLGGPYHQIFSGFLIVVDITADPVELLHYLSQYSPPGIDFLLPYDNHDRYPPGKENFEDASYGRWLVHAFDYWFDVLPSLRVREFDGLLRMILGGSSGVESIGVGPVDLVVIETNGDIEGVDSLKAAFHKASALGYDVFRHSFDTVAVDAAVESRHLGAVGLCDKCKNCPVVEFCGGGYLPNRYSASRGFDNPSVYCRDLELLIRHVYGRVFGVLQLNRERREVSCRTTAG